MNEFVELEKVSVSRLPGGIIRTTYREKAVVDLIDAKEVDRIYTTMAQGHEVFLLIDLTAKDADLTNEAQAYFSRKALIVPSIRGAAIVISGLRSRMVARFYIQYFKPLYSTRIFGSTDEAMKWFDTVRQEELVG